MFINIPNKNDIKSNVFNYDDFDDIHKIHKKYVILIRGELFAFKPALVLYVTNVYFGSRP